MYHLCHTPLSSLQGISWGICSPLWASITFVTCCRHLTWPSPYLYFRIPTCWPYQESISNVQPRIKRNQWAESKWFLDPKYHYDKTNQNWGGISIIMFLKNLISNGLDENEAVTYLGTGPVQSLWNGLDFLPCLPYWSSYTVEVTQNVPILGSFCLVACTSNLDREFKKYSKTQ